MRKMLVALKLAILTGLLSACMAAGGPAAEVYQTATAELARQWQATTTGVARATLMQTGKFRDLPRLQAWLDRAPTHRAIVVGKPDRCGYIAFAHGESSPAKAELAADRTCLGNITEYSEFAGVNCVCQTALIDQTIMAPPSAFDRYGAYKMIIEKADGGRHTTRGTAAVSGLASSGNPVRFLDRHGDIICRGTYDLAGRGGTFSLTCDGTPGTARGNLTVDMSDPSRSLSVGEGRFDDGGRVRFVVGAISAKFRERAATLGL